MRTGVNPITLRGKDQITGRPMGLSIARMHVRIGEPEKKLVPVAIFDDPGGEPADPKEAEARLKVMLVLDEQEFTDGLFFLFPTGEFDKAAETPVPVNTELVEGLRMAIAAVKGLGGDAKPLEDVLLRAGVPSTP